MSHRFVEVADPGSPRRWRVDATFLESNWTCIWGRACQGIGDEVAPALEHGCCSLGAELLDEDEAMTIAALGASLDPARFQFADAVADGGIFAPAKADGGAFHTRVVDGACVFLNRVEFDGPSGCALHVAAVDSGDDPSDWKPSVCWQLPIKLDADSGSGADSDDVVTLRPWTRDDFGVDRDAGEAIAWMCTEDRDPASAFVGEEPVVESLATELTALLGAEAYDAVVGALAERRSER